MRKSWIGACAAAAVLAVSGYTVTNEDARRRVANVLENYAPQAAERVREFGTATGELRQAAQRGDAAAAYRLGMMYARGNDVPQTPEKARFWLEKSAQQGYVKAQNNLAVMYSEGAGIPQNLELARYWWEQAARQGDVLAQHNLGVLYDKKENGMVSPTLAAYWWEQAAKQNYLPSQENLGMLWISSDLPQEQAKGFYWLHQAAQRGSLKAQTLVGRAYLEGRGTRVDTELGRQWLEKAADQNDADAQFGLGTLYARGRLGLPQDIDKAIFWLKRAADNGHPKAQSRYLALIMLPTPPKDASAPPAR